MQGIYILAFYLYLQPSLLEGGLLDESLHPNTKQKSDNVSNQMAPTNFMRSNFFSIRRFQVCPLA